MNIYRAFSILLAVMISLSIVANTVFASNYNLGKKVGMSYYSNGILVFTGKAFHVGDAIYVVGPAYSLGTLTGTYIIKVYTNGTIAWAKAIANNNRYYATDAEYRNGYIYVTGCGVRIDQTLTWVLFLMKIDLDGEVNESITINTSSIWYIPQVLRVNNSVAYVAGYTLPERFGASGRATGYSSEYGSMTTMTKSTSAFMAKVNLCHKNVEWIKIIDFDDMSNEASEMIFDIDLVNDSIYALGAHNSSLFILKADSDGNILSVHEYTLPLPVYYADMYVDSEDIYVEGEAVGVLRNTSNENSSSGNGGSASLTSRSNSVGVFGSTVVSSHSSEGTHVSKFVLKLSVSGDIIWSRLINDTATISGFFVPLWIGFGKLSTFGSTLYVPINSFSTQDPQAMTIGKSYIMKVSTEGDVEDILTLFPEINGTYSIIDLHNNIITGFITIMVESNNGVIYMPVPYVIWDRIPMAPSNFTPNTIDITSNVSVSSITPTVLTDAPISINTSIPSTLLITLNTNPIYLNFKVHVSQEDLSKASAHLTVDMLFMNSTINTINALLIPNSTSMVRQDYGWIVSIQDLAIIYSPIRITELSINNASVSLVLEKKSNISIVVPRNTVRKIIVDGVPVCDSINACEALRDTDNVIVVDPSNVTIVFTHSVSSGEGGSVLREGAGIGGGHGLGGEVTGTCYLEASIVIALALVVIGLYMAVIAGRK